MFKNFVLLAMAVVFFTGCAVNQRGSLDASFDQQFESISDPFIVIYGEHGSMLAFKQRATGSAEDHANMARVLMEPGFIVMIHEKAKNAGLDKQLQQLFEAEGFQMVGGRQHEMGFYRLNFARNGKRVIFG